IEYHGGRSIRPSKGTPMSSRHLSRRQFIGSAAIAAVTLPSGLRSIPSVFAADTYTPPSSPRTTYNFNLDWKFIRQDVPDAVPNAEARPFDDATSDTI